jgi:hypothetical protein
MKLNLDLNIHIYLSVFHENTTLIPFLHRPAAHVLLTVTLLKHIQLNSFGDWDLGLRPAVSVQLVTVPMKVKGKGKVVPVLN